MEMAMDNVKDDYKPGDVIAYTGAALTPGKPSPKGLPKPRNPKPKPVAPAKAPTKKGKASAFEKIKAGLEEAVAFSKGKDTGARVTVVKVEGAGMLARAIKEATPMIEKAVKEAVQQQANALNPNKTDLVVALLSRPQGATIEEVMAPTGWLKHSARAFITDRLRKKGHKITSTKEERGRVYRIVVEEAV